MYDLIIIGMGISGISAAIYAKRANLNVLLLESSAPGGTLNKISEIGNYPGIYSITGPDFAYELFESVQKLEIEYKLEAVTDVILDEEIKTIKTKNNAYQTKNVLIASGRKPRLLGLEHEEELMGKGLSTCALCDGNLFKDKEVAVVGGGSSALQEGLYLSKIVKKVYLIHWRDTFKAEDILVDEVKNTPNIEIIYNNEVKELHKKDDKLDSITLKDGKNISVAGLFIYIGFLPNTDFLKNASLKMDKGYIIVDNLGRTNINGVYASGDVIKKEVYQLINAASEGSLAAITMANNNKVA